MDEVKQAYNTWATQYDTNENKTRDLEGISLRTTLGSLQFDQCLEIGCGTGKNTTWITTKAKHTVAIDLSDEMLAKAKEKILTNNVEFIQADITQEWDFLPDTKFDMATFSLVLEHIENLDAVFEKLRRVVAINGHVYVGELHPFKQYNGTKARFETKDGLHIVKCYNHHVSDFVHAAKKYNFQVVDVNEYFDDDDKAGIPRILTLLFQKR